MKHAPRFYRVTDDVFVWHAFDPECNTDCSSTALRTPQGYVLIDPIQLEEQALDNLMGDAKITAIVLTNGNHQRASLYEKQRIEVTVFAP